ncbi:hypothetical protein, partial [Escherichia coli]|uniref:hypothetical protein n=1 Tax=Escherichia coli TaxID=562 RepID=UPI0030F3C998
RRGLADNLTASGVDPSSGRFNAVMNASKSDQSTGQIDTTTRGQVSQADKYIAGLQDIVALGAGQKADAMQNFNSLADNSLKKAQSDAQSAYAKQQGRASLVGAGLGAAGAFAMHRAGGTAGGDSGTPKTSGTGANAIQSYNWQWRG